MKFSESVELLYRSYSVNRRLRSSHVNVTMTNARRFLGLMKDLGAWLSESLLIFSIVVCRFRATIRGASFKNEREIRSGASPVLSVNS